ncbi:MAG: hypothetical protein ABI670_10145 [Chloroflexota bacterium]
MRLDLETEIRLPDGVRAGVLQKVIVDQHGHVENVVMATVDLVSRTVKVPISVLSEEAGDVLTINLSPDEIDQLPAYEEQLVPAISEGDGWSFNPEPVPGADVFPGTLYDPGMMPVTEQGNIAPDETTLSQGTQIWCEGESWGVVDEVLLDDDGIVYAFVGRPDAVDEHDRLIPIGLVSEYGPSVVVLNCTRADLPNYTQELVHEHEEPDAE